MLNITRCYMFTMFVPFVISALMLMSPVASAVGLYDSYACEVKSIRRLGQDGSMPGTVEFPYLSEDLGAKFVIDRDTGRMLGSLKNYDWGQQPKVVDRGSKEQAFKVITIFGPPVNIAYLQVGLFYSSLEKPFLYIKNTDIYAGLCTGL